ncbi:hypothetical protein BHE74_00018834 [Ensete ventricosum]|nr:hypothetical protein BHE74_00018834 [Ensete ventricosum]
MASWDFVQMQAAHDCSFVVISQQLEEQHIGFRVPSKVILFVPRGKDCPYHTFYGGFYLSSDALEVKLRLSPPLVVVAFLAFWWVSPSQLAPNSWSFLRVALWACDGTILRVIPLLLRLSRSSSNYYLSPRMGFKIEETSSYSKGWWSRFFIVDGSED